MVNVLYLGPLREHMIHFIEKSGDRVICTERKISIGELQEKNIEFIVSYGYRHLIGVDIIDRYQGNIINLHISYLPWNKGADPNLWSFIDDTLKGVSIHEIDEGLDTGNILVQRQITFNDNETLKSSYDKLTSEIENLFMEHWMEIRDGKISGKPQIGKGSYHCLADRQKISHLLADGWDTVIRKLVLGRD